MKSDAIQEAAILLSSGRLALDKMHMLPPETRPVDESDAYLVQDVLHQLLSDGGFGKLAGHKIGCTTSVMQGFLGIGNPCAGGVFKPTVRHYSGSFKFNQFLHPGVECEMAVRLGADLPSVGTPYDIDSVAPAVESVMAAIEIVDDRWVDYKSIDTPTLIADDFFGAACVLGKPAQNWSCLNLPDISGTMSINGVSVGSGTGSDIMGHPFQALVWLADSMAKRGKELCAGEIVLLGSLVETKWVEQGDTVSIDLPGIGGGIASFD